MFGSYYFAQPYLGDARGGADAIARRMLLAGMIILARLDASFQIEQRLQFTDAHINVQNPALTLQPTTETEITIKTSLDGDPSLTE